VKSHNRLPYARDSLYRQCDLPAENQVEISLLFSILAKVDCNWLCLTIIISLFWVNIWAITQPAVPGIYICVLMRRCPQGRYNLTVKEKRVMALSILNKPLHRIYHVPPRGMLAWIGIIICEYNDIFWFILETSCVNTRWYELVISISELHIRMRNLRISLASSMQPCNSFCWPI
jgi:hypothetical protein